MLINVIPSNRINKKYKAIFQMVKLLILVLNLVLHIWTIKVFIKDLII